MELPYVSQLLDAAGMSSETITTEKYIGSAGLLYAADLNAVVAYNPKKDYSLVYDTRQKTWMISDIAIIGKINAKGGAMALGRSEKDKTDIVEIKQTGNPISTFVVTRPIKLDMLLSGRNIRSIEILGQFGFGKVRFAAYGTTDMRQWHLVTSSESNHAEEFSNCHYRMMRVCVCARLEEDEYLYGLLIDADD